jgi:methyltransferase (TIGR00027 family)
VRSSQPSLTALGVALARSTLERPSTPGGDPDGDDALTASLLDDAPEELRGRGARHAGDPGPDFVRSIGVRTAFFDGAVQRAIAAGTSQIVILGAGYDGRALRFRAAGTTFFEVDHPATQADKRGRLDELGIATDDIVFVTADFTEPGLEAALAAAGHRDDQPTQFLLEGVLRYLPERWFKTLLASVRQCAAPYSELAASISTRRPDETEAQAQGRRERERRLAEAGEAVLTVPARADALRWLADAGWALASATDMADAATDATAGGLHRGRLLVRAHPTGPATEGIDRSGR